MRQNLRTRGFTLLELLIAIIIFAVLSAMVSGSFFTSIKKGRDARRITDLEQVQKSLEMYYEDKRAYPTPTGTYGLYFGQQLKDDVSNKIYMQKLPNDPVGSMNYEYSLNGNSYRLYACLENTQQKLPYTSFTAPSMTCPSTCFYQDGTPANRCVWVLSSPDISP